MGEAKKLISGSSVVFTGTMIGSFFAYLFNMLTGRMLGPALYGEFTALLSLTSILLVGGGAISIVTMKYASILYAKKNISGLQKLFKKFSAYVFFLAMAMFIICIVLIHPIENYFSITKLLPVIITFSSFFFGFLIIINRGILQGSQKFFVFSLTNALEMFIRLVLGIALVKIGLGLTGSMSAVVLSTAFVYLISLLFLKNIFSLKGKKEENFKFDKKEIFNYSMPALVSAGFLAVALNLDIILVKHFFTPETAGVYAAVSTIGKIILYATSPIVGVMFPLISEKKETGEKHYKLLMFSILLTVVGALVILGVYFVAPGTVIKILYGSDYLVFYSLLPKVGFFILLYALVNIMANYFLAVKNFVFLYFFGVVLVGQIILVELYHNSLEIVIKVLIITTALLFVLLFGYYLITKIEQLKQLFNHNTKEAKEA